jgi:hypothetical protein
VIARLPRIGAVTMVRNEGPMLHKWVSYYGAQLGHGNLLVLDDHSDDGAPKAADCRVKRIRPITGDFETTRMELVSKAASKLLRRCDGVIFADADEFIVPDPDRYDGLRDFAAANAGRGAVGVTCLNVIQHMAAEKPLDLALPVLGQRQMAKFLPLFCKPSLKFVKNPWAASSHGIRGVDFTVDPSLMMFHLKFADRDHLIRIAADRHSAMVNEGRAPQSSWQFTSDEMVALLDEVNQTAPADPAELPEFSIGPEILETLVRTMPNGVRRARGARQVTAMQKRPLVRIPQRFAGLV